MSSEKIYVTPGGLHIDDRGQLSVVHLPFADIKRCYVVSNHKTRFVRAWHYHKNESKWITVLHGAALVAAVKIKRLDLPPAERADGVVQKVVLSAADPSVAWIPPGYANGAMTLTPGTKIMYFSDRTVEESRHDDVRLPADWWPGTWTVEQR